MENLDILEKCQDKTLHELAELIELLEGFRYKKYNETYKEIRIHPGERIENKIFQETGFKCFYEPSCNHPVGRGTHIICIPKEKWTKALERELKDKYDDKW